MGARRNGRILAFQTLYRYDCTEESPESLMDFSWCDPKQSGRRKGESQDFARLIIVGTIQQLTEIDSAISNQLEHWDFSRLARVDLAILRISVYCLLYQAGIPHSVTIDEAIDIAKEFGSDDSYRFVNGVLDGIRKRLQTLSN